MQWAASWNLRHRKHKKINSRSHLTPFFFDRTSVVDTGHRLVFQMIKKYLEDLNTKGLLFRKKFPGRFLRKNRIYNFVYT